HLVADAPHRAGEHGHRERLEDGAVRLVRRDEQIAAGQVVGLLDLVCDREGALDLRRALEDRGAQCADLGEHERGLDLGTQALTIHWIVHSTYLPPDYMLQDSVGIRKVARSAFSVLSDSG